MSGWRKWSLGELVEFDDFQSFVQNQVVQVYPDASTRTSSLGTAVQAGMVSYLTDTNTLEAYSAIAGWVDVGADGQGVSEVIAGTALTGGGTAGTVTLDVNLSAVATSVLASPNITGTATISAGSVTGNLTVSGTATLSANTSIGSVSSSELGFLDGVTSSIQTQLGARVLTTNGAVTTAATNQTVVRNITLSTATPSGGMDGDVWLQYTP